MKFIREKDLKHHLENGEDTKPKVKPQTIEKSGLISDKVTIDKKTKEKIKDDNQLNTALLVLKSMNMISKPDTDK
jgi:hypothetical protein